MTVREDREVRAPPAMALAALATAGENIGYTVRDVRAREGILIMTGGSRWRGVGLGFILTARVRRFNEGSRVSLDATPMVGSWARKSADLQVDKLVREFQLVLSAPHARIRRPEKARPGGEPFGAAPRLLAVVWVLVAVGLFGLVLGGWWWLGALIAAVGSVMVFTPKLTPWWTWTVVGAAVLSLPAGLFGLIARRMARANQLWGELLHR